MIKIKFLKVVLATALLLVPCFTIYRTYIFKQKTVPQWIIERNQAGRDNYWKDAAAIHSAAEKIRTGNDYSHSAKYEEAAYEQAYAIGGGFRGVSGLHLAETYEKMGQFDKAISLLNNMILKGQLSETGAQMARLMVSRLEASKIQSRE